MRRLPHLAICWLDAEACTRYNLSSLHLLQVGGTRMNPEAAQGVRLLPSGNKLPERLEMRSAFPLTSAGKANKTALRELLAHMLAAERVEPLPMRPDPS